MHFYYNWSDWVLPPVGTNRLFKIVMDQTINLGPKCATYISLVRKTDVHGQKYVTTA